MMRLKADVVSFGKNRTVYGKKGDIVKIIGDYGNVQAVEGPDGNKYPCPTDNLTEEDIAAPGATAAKKNKINWLPVSDKPEATKTQNKLF